LRKKGNKHNVNTPTINSVNKTSRKTNQVVNITLAEYFFSA